MDFLLIFKISSPKSELNFIWKLHCSTK